MRFQSFGILIILVSLGVVGCGGAEVKGAGAPSRNVLVSNKPLTEEKTKLFIGQDLNSIRGYVKSGQFPQPSGVTTYLSFYGLLSSNHPSYGGLGLDNRGYPTNQAVDWGAGPLNAYALAKEYPNLSFNVGLNIAEGNQSAVWVDGGLKSIAKGKYDSEINKLAAFFKSVKNPIYLRIGYEFDGVWNKGYENTRDYISAYKHIVNLLRSKQVSNVVYVWQASASPIDDIIESKRERISAWYPGDKYVDWIGLSWFLPPDKSVKGAPTQRMLANEVLQFARTKGKPVIIAEASPQGYDIGNISKSNISPLWDGIAGKQSRWLQADKIWGEWFAPFFTFIRENKDIIKAVAYINADWDSQELWAVPFANGYWGDSRLQVNPEISKRWLSEISDKSYWD